jgi:phosphoenolpyruvate-protein phosphotransferase (PTS system enzyme I)
MGFGRPCFSNVQASELVGIASQKSTDITQHLTNTFKQLSNDLQRLAREAEERVDKDTAEIFDAHRLIIEDTSLQDLILNSVTDNIKSAEEAVESCFDAYYSYFNGLNDQYANGRAEIFSELKQLLLNLLRNTDITLSCRDAEGCTFGQCSLGNDHILIIKELNAYAMARVSEHTKGIIAEICGKNSHGAIIARALGIPVISGIVNIEKDILCSSNLLVNGNTGSIIINPDEATLALLKESINVSAMSLEPSEPSQNLRVLADINQWTDVQDAIKVKAEGIGLYRTEMEALKMGRFLSEEEQYRYYKSLIESMDGKPIYIRLFDLGGDKSTEWLELEDEENPALGCRGARYLLLHPDLVKSQARAIARASKQAPINVIYPMIFGLEQFMQLKKLFMDSIDDIKYDKISHGVMFEVPSACIEAEELYKEIDFGRIGSNDLVQYLFAYDRGKDDFNYEETLQSPAIWKLISELVQVANKACKPLEVCGEMTNNPVFIPKLIKLGITTVSVDPHNIARIRKAADMLSV